MEKPYNIYQGDYRITAAGKVLLKHPAVFRMPIGKLLVMVMDLTLMPTDQQQYSLLAVSGR